MVRELAAQLEREVGELKQHCDDEQARINSKREVKESPEAMRRVIRLANLKKEVADANK